MTSALFHVTLETGRRWAVGDTLVGPQELLGDDFSLDRVLADAVPLEEALASAARVDPMPARAAIAAPLESQPVWAAGVTYLRSRDARREESGGTDFYDRVYEATRPELFFKAMPGTVRANGEAVAIREDSIWNVPEPELALLADARGRLAGITLGNDMSSRSIEGENPLYLPQAKIYDGSCAVGPCVVPAAPGADLRQLSLELRIARAGADAFVDRVSVSSMRRDPEQLLAWLFHSLSFPCGALLLTGTSTVPPSDFTLQAGDEISISCPAIGSLVNIVRPLPVRSEAAV